MNDAHDLPLDEAQQDEEMGMAQFMGTPEEYLQKYTHCVICGSNLHFTHITDFVRNLTQESSRCPECGVCPRKSVHSLQ